MSTTFIILRREYLDLTKDFCAAKLIEYFKHWTNWKLKNHRTPWIYQPLKKIYEGLMGEHSLHVIRRAIALLESMGIIEKQKNPGNGQDKTYQYMLHPDILSSLLNEHRKCQSEEPECKNEHAEFTVESHHKINPKTSDSISSDPSNENEEKEPTWDVVAEQASSWEQDQVSKLDTDPDHADEPKQGVQSNDLNPELDNHSAAPPTPTSKVPKHRTIKQLEKEVWEIAPRIPFPVFLNWRAETRYKPQGGKWADDAYGNAYGEFYNNRQKTTAILFPKFLEYLRSCSENCNQQTSADMKALLPSIFIIPPEATEENVEQTMQNIYQLVSKGTEVALPQGIATPSCNQSMSFAEAQDTRVSPLKELTTSKQPHQIEAIMRYLETGNEPAARAIARLHNIDIGQIKGNLIPSRSVTAAMSSCQYEGI